LPGLTEKQVLYFLTQFIVLVLTARMLADVMRRAGHATVIGELMAGLVWGPSVLGKFLPGVQRAVFPPDPIVNHLLESSAWIGVIMLLLCTGLETDLDTLRGMRRPAAMVSVLGIAIPFAGGFLLGWWLPAAYLPAGNQRLIFALFMAVAMSISAVPVIAKILIDLDLMRREIGVLILAAGVLDDLVGWILLSVVAGLATRGVVDLRSLSSTVFAAAAFLLLCYFVGFRIVARVLRWVDDHAYVEHAGLTVMVGMAFVCAVITQAIGIHAVFGAFIGGLMIGRSARMRKTDREQLQAVTMGVLAPVFFAYSGLRADLLAITSVGVPALVLGVAFAGKLAGCTLGGILSGLRRREAFAVAAGMNARGGMEIVVAMIGLGLGILTPEMYTVILMVAIVTSLAAPPLLSWSLAGVPERPGDAKRTEREKILGKLPFTKEGAKLLVLDAGGPHAQMATHLAAALGNHREASITIFHARRASPSPEVEAQLKDRFAGLKATAELCGAHNVHQRTALGDSIAELILQESRRGYDAIFMGASQLRRRDRLSSSVMREFLAEVPVPVIIARSYGESMPFKRVLAPTTDASYSRVGIAVAMLYAQSIKTDVNALYVMETPSMLRGIFRGRPPIQLGAEIVDEVNDLAKQLELKVDTQIGSGNRAEKVILRALADGKFDLLMMGVLYRSVDHRVYFGPKVEQILDSARCAVAVVVSPSAT
jgi:Kef-type K+ transport system membrane component KefB/nucleotide-binding universal stress UspA family protein